MKSPLLIIFLLLNLLSVNLTAAVNMYDEELSESHLIQAQQPGDIDNATPGSCLDESSCDHFCHFSAHMAGFISQITTPFSRNSTTPFIITSESLYSLNIEPPFQPPRS